MWQIHSPDTPSARANLETMLGKPTQSTWCTPPARLATRSPCVLAARLHLLGDPVPVQNVAIVGATKYSTDKKGETALLLEGEWRYAPRVREARLPLLQGGRDEFLTLAPRA